jgi:two-component system chemotaxis response regulator CheY
MRSLIVEDDFTSRKILQAYLSVYGQCHISTTGTEGVEAFKLAWEESRPYDLICMDIMMPELNGQDALRMIRGVENDMGLGEDQKAKVIMTTALSASKEVVEAFYKGGASAYFVKPLDRAKIVEELKLLHLIAR